MLKIVVGASIFLPSGLSGSNGCSARTAKPTTKIADVEQQQRDGVLLPVLRPGVDPLLEPAQPARQHGNGRRRSRPCTGRAGSPGRRSATKIRSGKSPHGESLSPVRTTRAQQRRQEVDEQQHGHEGGQKIMAAPFTPCRRRPRRRTSAPGSPAQDDQAGIQIVRFIRQLPIQQESLR